MRPTLPYLSGFQEGALASFLPGRPPDVFPEGIREVDSARREARVRDSLRQNLPGRHRPTAPAWDSTWRRGRPERVLRRMDLRNFFFRIPPGAASHEVKRCYTFEQDKLLLSITPHMHYRGKDVRYELIRPDGAREILLSVPRYDFNWQLVYRFQDPVRVEKGSLLMSPRTTTTARTIPPIPIRRKPCAGATRARKR